VEPVDRAYSPFWLLDLARSQRPQDDALIAALAACTRVVGECDCGCGDPYFVDPAEWGGPPGRTVELRRADGVTVLVDMLGDERVGHVETGEWHRKR